MSEKENHEESIEDEQVRKDIQIISARLYDLRERFMKIVQKINNDATDYIDQISDDTTDDEEDSDSTETSSDDEQLPQKSKQHLKLQLILIESIIRHKSSHYEYLKYIKQYPKIIKYILNDDPDYINIPLRYLEPFIKEHVNKNPNGKIYDKISQQVQDIRYNYLKNRH